MKYFLKCNLKAGEILNGDQAVKYGLHFATYRVISGLGNGGIAILEKI